jgi:hypothetical protein
MRSSALLSVSLALGVLLSGCAAAPGGPSSAQTPESPVSPPTPGTVHTYAPDPERATVQGSWAFDVSDVREVILDADSVSIGTVNGIDARGTFEFSEGGLPMTRVNVEVRRVLHGDEAAGADLYVPGGTVTLQQVFESDPAESTEKNGIAGMDEEERRSTTVDYVPPGPVRLEVGKEYVFMTRHSDETGIHGVAAGGYGVFEATGEGYANHLTGDVFTLDELVAMIASSQKR